MDQSGSKVSSLPWVWIIEHLAKNKQVKPSFLHAVIEAAPDIPDDIGKNMREAVSLRCLEELSGSPNGCLDSASLGNSRTKIDSSKSCEDVLRRLLHHVNLVASLPEAALPGKELLKWDIHSFTEQKKASMPRTALEELKDTIVDGTHPHASSLRDMSGLTRVNIHDRILVSDDDADCEPDTCQPNETTTGDYNTVFHRNSLQEGESCVVKRGLRDPAIDNSVQTLREICSNGDSGVDCPKSKRLKQNSSSYMQYEKATSVNSPERLHVPAEREAMNSTFEQIGAFSEQSARKECNSTFEQIGAFSEQSARKECNGDPRDHGCDEEIPNGTESHHKVSNSQPGCETLEESKEASASKVQMRETISEEGGCCTVHCIEEISSDSDGYQTEEVDITMKKHEFLNSNCTSDDNPLPMADWTEQNVCMKCNKGGQLLVCQSIGCPLVVHQNCVDPSSSFDDDANFFCPFCGYSKSISQYFEARKKVSLARKDLAEFMDMIAKHQLESLYRKQNNISGNGENEPVNLCQDGFVSDKAGNREMQKDQGQKEQVEPSERSMSGSGHIDNWKVGTEIVPEHGLSSREKELHRTNGPLPPIKKVKGKKAMQKGASGVLEGQEDQALANHRDEGANLAHNSPNNAVKNWNVDGIDGGEEVLPCTNKHASIQLEKPTSPNLCGADFSEDEDHESNIWDYKISFRT